MTDRNFGGVIWTNHALARLTERGIKQGDAWATFQRPQESRRAAIPGAWVYYRVWGNQKIEVVAKKNEKRQWVILSVWSRPVYPDTPTQRPESLLKLVFRRFFRK